MRRRGLISSLFFLGCGIGITVCSLRLPVGTFREPNSGLLPLIVGVLLSILSTALLIRSSLESFSRKEKPFWGEERKWHKIVATVLALLLYTLSLERVGFLFATFLLMSFLFKPIGGRGWKFSLAGAIVTSSISYLVFKVFLKVDLPAGLWGF